LTKIENWQISHAPPPSDIIWENLSHLTRVKRKLLRLLYFVSIFAISIIVIIILAISDKISAILELIKHFSENQNVYIVIAQQYMTPTFLLFYNYTIVPYMIEKFVEKALYIRKSHKERSELSMDYIFLILNSIFIPLSCFVGIYSLTLYIIKDASYYVHKDSMKLKFMLVPTG